MSGRMAAAAAFVGLASLVVGSPAAFAIPAVGTRAPSIDLPTIRGGHFNLGAALGRKPILLNFFASW